MRLPFVQVDQRYIAAQSKMVASRLRVSQAEALGLGVTLFTFAVEATWTEEEPPSGVFMGDDAGEILESAIEWRGEPGKAIGAFVRADVIEQLEGGLRVRGMDRYREAWEKQRKRRLAAKAGADARWGNASCDSAPIASQSHASRTETAQPIKPNRSAKTQTQTQTHIEAPPTTTAPVEVLKPADPPPSAVPDPEAIRAFVEFEEARAEHFGGIPVPNPPPSWEADFPVLLKSHEGDRDWALQTYRHFWSDPWAQKLRPPGALQAFIKPEQWVKHVRPREAGPEPGLLGAPQAQELWQQSGTPTALWALVLALMRQDGQGFLSERFAKLRPGLPKNGTVQLFAADPFTRTWALDFGQLVEQYLGQALGEAVAVEFPEPEVRAAVGGGT